MLLLEAMKSFLAPNWLLNTHDSKVITHAHTQGVKKSGSTSEFWPHVVFPVWQFYEWQERDVTRKQKSFLPILFHSSFSVPIFSSFLSCSLAKDLRLIVLWPIRLRRVRLRWTMRNSSKLEVLPFSKKITKMSKFFEISK